MAESVTICAGCGGHRLCREYGGQEHHPECKFPYYGGGVHGCISRCQYKEGIWLCLRRTWKCWKNRKTILASKKEDK